MALGGTPIQKPVISVFGMFGSFEVASETTQGIVVRYFSTVASGTDNATAGNSLALLKELKPMRERVKVSDLRDLGSLLQRELDDNRVAQELVPYLKGANSPVGFFPGILVALVPRGFLKSDETATYPNPGDETVIGDEATISYGDYWSARRFKLGDQFVSLGQLDMDPKKTDLIVLDGQHRANAFRYVTNTFDVVQNEDSIYRAFYEGTQPPSEFNSELPVTIVWFESPAGIDPRLISRKLFVDVNTNAKPVSESRNVLLDDRSRSSILTGSFYRLLASRAFDANQLSLLHTGFDCEEKQRHPLALMVPSEVRYALAYMGFARDEALSLSYSVQYEYFLYEKTYSRLRKIEPTVEELDIRASEDGDRQAFERTVKTLDEHVGPKLLKIIESFPLTEAHIAASTKLDAWISSQSVMLKEAWDKVYRGGEGLYAGFIRAEAHGRALNYQSAIKEIADKFIALRQAELKPCSAEQVSRSYETFSTKAALTGLLMAAHNFCKIHPKGWTAIDEYITALKKVSASQWAQLFAEYKPVIASELSPKLWPIMRNIVLRAIQGRDPKLKFFDTSTVQSENPDMRYIRNRIERMVDSYESGLSIDDTDRRPDPERVETWRKDALDSLKQALKGADLTPMHSDDALKAFASDLVDKRLPEVKPIGTDDFDGLSVTSPEE